MNYIILTNVILIPTCMHQWFTTWSHTNVCLVLVCCSYCILKKKEALPTHEQTGIKQRETAEAN